MTTNDTIIRLAREAGIQVEIDCAERLSMLATKDGGACLPCAEEIVRFYHLVRNAVLEECAYEFDGLYTNAGVNISARIRAMRVRQR